ncbi:EboA domain-containing protein [Sphaerisporangium aureirubrum]|uniref:EboA domain-containing protein n=1 Tax=Sphaerisporangium aureirubrum TaxID=1544736 RepID=A0ABW1NET2_9ACTN
MVTLDDLRAALAENGSLTEHGWLAGAVALVAADPGAIGGLFPAAGRRCGRGPLPALPGWTVDQAARALLLAALPSELLADEVEAVYRYGDAAEKLAVLKALPLLPLGDAAVVLLHDALRTNDTRLVAAALGPYATRLDDAAWRQGVLKCVFMGVPLKNVHGVPERADARLAAMLDAFARERRAAGREVPADALAVLEQVKEG